MITRATLTLDEGFEAFRRIRSELASNPVDWNEADTRFHVIDRLLVECLGWPKDPKSFQLEKHSDGEYFDYLLGNPSSAIWEAKRTGSYFDFPADIKDATTQPLRSLFIASPQAEAAIRQVQGYCGASGVEVGVVCNGHQIVAFIAVRIGAPWISGQALIFKSLAHLEANFGTFWQCLSPDGIAEKRLISLLTLGSTRAVPSKLSASLFRFPHTRYKTELQANLRALSELLLEDVVSTEPMRARFLRDCYCETGALSRDALLSQEIIQARYAALFPLSDDAPRLEPAAGADDEFPLSRQIMTEALARRPIVLLGDVGVGKTSFLEDLMYVRAEKEFETALTIYLDLGSKAALSLDIRKFVLDDIERQLQAKYKVDLQEHNFVRGVYDLEIKRFRSSFKAKVYQSNKTKLDERLMSRLEELVNDQPEHLRRSIEHIALARKHQVIIILDNADQRKLEVQQEAFIIAQDFARNWNALVFIAVRPQTFFQSKRSGALSAYPHKVLTILPPRPELVIEKRLIFALRVAEGRVPSEMLKGVRLNIGNMSHFLRALIYSLDKNRDLKEILANITGGNIRALVEFITRFIGSPNVEAEKIVNIQRETGQYIIPLHEFSKAAILGEYSNYVQSSSLAMNVFDVATPDRREHFLALMVMAYLLAESTSKDRDGFIGTERIISELKSHAFLEDQIRGALRRLTNKRLLETTERITFEEDLLGLVGDMPEGFRATSIGVYHLRRWAGTFAYVDAMITDTSIFDTAVYDAILKDLDSYDIGHRYNRAVLFRNYLTETWTASGLRPTYFDWMTSVRAGAQTFDSVSAAVQKINSSRERQPRHRPVGRT
jgi:GTPase SAR1 family protein